MGIYKSIVRQNIAREENPNKPLNEAISLI